MTQCKIYDSLAKNNHYLVYDHSEQRDKDLVCYIYSCVKCYEKIEDCTNTREFKTLQSLKD